jgi:hypothetical protein
MMDADNFKWLLAYTDNEGDVLHCVPKTSDGKPYPYDLCIWRGTLSKYYGEILNTAAEETIELSGDDLFELIGKMQQKTMVWHEGE